MKPTRYTVDPQLLAWWNDQQERLAALASVQRKLYPNKRWSNEDAKRLAIEFGNEAAKTLPPMPEED